MSLNKKWMKNCYSAFIIGFEFPKININSMINDDFSNL